MKKKTKKKVRRLIKKTAAPIHEDFLLGQGYGSSEKDSESRQHPSQKQYGDNARPKSGGGYGKPRELQDLEK